MFSHYSSFIPLVLLLFVWGTFVTLFVTVTNIFLRICFQLALITDKEPCKFAVNKRQNTNYSFLPVTSKVSCIRRKRGQIICLQGNNKSMVIFVLKRRKCYDKIFNVKYLPLFHHLKPFTNFQNIVLLVKIVANAPLNIEDNMLLQIVPD